MRARTFEQFTALAEESQATRATNASPIRIELTSGFSLLNLLPGSCA
jgi:hypothetical protein